MCKILTWKQCEEDSLPEEGCCAGARVFTMNPQRTVLEPPEAQPYGHDGVRFHPKNDGSQAAVMTGVKELAPTPNNLSLILGTQ